MQEKKKVDKKGKKEPICSRCHKKIIFGDTYVCLGTHKGDTIIEEDYYHIRCWEDYFRERMDKRIQDLSRGIVTMMGNMMPIVASYMFNYPNNPFYPNGKSYSFVH